MAGKGGPRTKEMKKEKTKCGYGRGGSLKFRKSWGGGSEKREKRGIP